MMHVNVSTISRWESGKQNIGPISDLFMRLLYAGSFDLNLKEIIGNFSGIDFDNSRDTPRMEIPIDSLADESSPQTAIM